MTLAGGPVVVGTYVNFISEMGTPNTVWSSDFALFTTCARAAAGITPLLWRNDGSKM